MTASWVRVVGAVWAGLIVLCIAVPAQADPVDAAVRFDGHKVVRVTLRNLTDVRTMQALSDDPWTCSWSADDTRSGSHQADFRVSPDAFTALSESDIPFTVLVDNVQTLIDNERTRLSGFVPRDANWFSDFKSYDDVNTYLDQLVASHPTMVSRSDVGFSIEGRAIRGITIRSPIVSAAPKPVIAMIACQHAREWITVMSAMWFADHLVQTYGTDPAATTMLDAFDVVVIPISNPDGYVYTWSPIGDRLWRKNRRGFPGTQIVYGVDLNRNWDSHFGVAGTSSDLSNDTYCGASPFSEPCTLAIKTFLESTPTLAFMIDVHSYGQFILEPWGYTPEPAPNSIAFSQLGVTMRDAIYAPYHTSYFAGPTYTTLYPTSGSSTDWTYEARGVFSIGLELRGDYTGSAQGFIVPPDTIVPNGVELFDGVSAAGNWILQNAVTVAFPNDRPSTVPFGGTVPVNVQFDRGSKTLMPGIIPTVYTRIGRFGAFTSTALTIAGTQANGVVYSHQLTPGPCGAVVQWYYTLPLSDGTIWSSPLSDGQSAYQALTTGPFCTHPPCPGDFSQDGVLNVEDIFDFLREWFSRHAIADIDGVNGVNVTDIFAFLRAWFSGCP